MSKTAEILQPNGDRAPAFVVSRGAVALLGVLLVVAGLLWGAAQAVFGQQAANDSRFAEMAVEVRHLKEAVAELKVAQARDSERLLSAIERLAARAPGAAGEAAASAAGS